MTRLRIYPDTSVIGGCLDEEFAEDSLALVRMVQEGEAVFLISDILLDELEDAPPEVGRVLRSIPPDHVDPLSRSDEVIRLRDWYLSNGILGPRWADDALHVA